MRSRGLGTNIVITFLRQGVGLVVTLGLVALIARVFGPEGQGRYALAVFLPTILVLFSNLGVPFANAYFLGRGAVSPRSALATSLKLWVLLSFCGTTVGAVVVHFMADTWFPGVGREMLWIALGALPLALLHALLVSLLQGLQDFNRYNVAMFAQPVTALLLTVAAIIALHWGIEGALVAYGFSWLLSALTAWWVLTPHLRTSRREEEDAKAAHYARRCIAYGWKVQVSINLAFLSYRASTLLINYFMSTAATGVYFIAVSIAEKIWLLSQAASQVLLPRLSELHNDEERRRRLTPLATKIVFAISAAIAAVLFVATGPFIVGIFGDRFGESVGALRWLLPGIVLMSAARTLAIDLAARGRVDLNLYVAVLSLVMNVAASVIMIPRYGINGAAIATTLSYGLNFVVLVALYTRISGNVWYELLVWRRADYRVIKGKIDSLKGTGK
jgi:O-antigen/teichoic acid export membrane protein